MAGGPSESVHPSTEIDRASQKKEKYGTFGSHLSAVRRENQRLLATNNSLQLRILEANENNEDEIRIMKEKNRKLKEQLMTITFVLKSRTKSFKEKEKENEKMRQQLSRLETISKTGCDAQKPEIVVSNLLDKKPTIGNIRAASEEKIKKRSEEFSLINSLQDRVAALEHTLAAEKTQNLRLSNENEIQQKRILLRQEEIKRLAEILETERNWDRIAAENMINEKEFEIKKLHDQIDVLNGAKQEFEEELLERQESLKRSREEENEIQMLQKQNARLTESIEKSGGEIESLVNQIEEERAANRKEVQRLRKSLQEKEETISELSEQMRKMTSNVDAVQNKFSETLSKIEEKDSLVNNLDHRLVRANLEKKQLESRIAMVESEKKFHETQARKHLENYNKILSGHETAKVVHEEAQKRVMDDFETVSRQLNGEKLRFTKLLSDHEELLRKSEELEIKVANAEKVKADSLVLKSTVEELKNFNKGLNETLKEKDVTLIGLKEAEEKIGKLLSAKIEDNKKLLRHLQMCQQQINEINERVKSVTKEKEKLRHELKNKSAELLFKEQHDENKTRSETDEEIKSLREERDRYVDKVEELTKIISDQESKIRLIKLKSESREEELEEAQKKLKQIGTQLSEKRLDAEITFRETKTERQLLESNLLKSESKLKSELRKTAQLQERIDELDLLCRRNAASRDEMSQSLNNRNQLIQSLEGKLDALSSERNQALKDKETSEKESHRLSVLLKTLDEERDNLQNKLDSKEEILQTMKKSSEKQVGESHNVQDRLQKIAAKCSRLSRDLNLKEAELKQAQMQINGSRVSLAQREEKINLYQRELTTRMGDLNNMTKENQLLNEQVRTMRIHERQIAKKCTATMANQAILEQRLKAKEREIQDIISAYKAACFENQRLKRAVEESEKLRVKLSTNLTSNAQHLKQLHLQLQSNQRQIQKLLLEIKGYEAERETLTQSLRRRTQQIHALQRDRQNLGTEVAGSRNAAIQLKESQFRYQRMIASKDDEIRKLQGLLSSFQLKNDNLLEQRRSREREIGDLELLVASSRERLHEVETSAHATEKVTGDSISELTREVSHLKILNQSLRGAVGDKDTTILDQRLKILAWQEQLRSFLEMKNIEEDPKFSTLHQTMKSLLQHSIPLERANPTISEPDKVQDDQKHESTNDIDLKGQDSRYEELGISFGKTEEEKKEEEKKEEEKKSTIESFTNEFEKLSNAIENSKEKT